MKKIAINNYFFLLTLLLGTGFLISSCEQDELEDPSLENVDKELALTVSETELELEESFINKVLDFNWTTGTNQGTNAAILYTLEVDLVENDFSDPLLVLVQDEKIRYSYSIDHGTLNHLLLQEGLQPGETIELKARVIADVAGDVVGEQVSQTTFTVTTFKPVSNTLFLVGDATPNGWDIEKAVQLTASTAQRGLFTWEGPLTEGNFKFAVNRDGCFCQDFYTQGEDPGVIIYNEGGSGEDIQWTVEEADTYRIKVDLLNKTFSMEPVEDAPFSELYIVGDATESGWNIDDPAAFIRSEEDPFIFTYTGNLNPGNFKILAGETGDFCGEWYRPLENGQAPVNGIVEQRAGCEPDYNWTITEETAGRYRVILNTKDNSIRFEKIQLYIVGDGGPSGWDINTPQALVYENGEFVFTGALGAENPTGEFKFSNQVGDWCGGVWVNSANPSQSISNTDFIRTVGCDGPDNKWKLQEGDAGEYEIRIDLDNETMTINRL